MWSKYIVFKFLNFTNNSKTNWILENEEILQPIFFNEQFKKFVYKLLSDNDILNIEKLLTLSENNRYIFIHTLCTKKNYHGNNYILFRIFEKIQKPTNKEVETILNSLFNVNQILNFIKLINEKKMINDDIKVLFWKRLKIIENKSDESRKINLNDQILLEKLIHKCHKKYLYNIFLCLPKQIWIKSEIQNIFIEAFYDFSETERRIDHPETGHWEEEWVSDYNSYEYDDMGIDPGHYENKWIVDIPGSTEKYFEYTNDDIILFTNLLNNFPINIRINVMNSLMRMNNKLYEKLKESNIKINTIENGR